MFVIGFESNSPSLPPPLPSNPLLISSFSSVKACVGSIEMTGIGQETKIISTGVEEEKEGPLVDFQLEVNPLEREDMDLVIKTYVRPLKITYHEVQLRVLVWLLYCVLVVASCSVCVC